MKMYKLFVTRATKQISSHGVSFLPKQGTVQRSMRLCSFCNFYHGKISKCRSVIKKKVKQRTKQYTELLAVTNEMTSNKRTEVKKLTDLSILVDNSDITTNSLYNVKSPAFHQSLDSKYVDDYHNDYHDNAVHSDIQNYSNVITDDKMTYDTLHKKNDLVDPNTVNEINNAVDQNTSISLFYTKKARKTILESSVNSMPSKEHSYKTKNMYHMQNYIENLLVHMQVYLSCGLLNRANNTLMKFRKYNQNDLKCCNQVIELYNMLLEAYASNKKKTKVLELYELIKKDSLQPVPQTYVYIFDVFGREKLGNNQIGILKKLKDEMNSYNISFNDVIIKSSFKYDQLQNVLKTIRFLKPGYEISHPELSTKYMCKLISEVPMKSNYESPAKELLTIAELQDLAKIQMENECAIQVQIPSICNESKNKDTKASSVMNEKIMEAENFWKKAAMTAFERNLKCLKQKELHSHKNLMVLYPFLEVLAKEQYVNAILREIKQLASGSETYSTSLRFLHISLGKYIHKQYEIETQKRNGVLDKMTNVYSKYLEWYLQPESMPNLNNMNNRIVWQYFEREEMKNGATLNVKHLNWPTDVMINIGKFLYNIILNDIIFPPHIFKGQDTKCSIPAFYTIFRNRGTYLSEQIKPHPFVSKLYKESHLDMLTFDSIVLPTYTPPSPWMSIYSGGYLLLKTSFMRIPDQNDRPWRKLQNSPPEQLFPILDSLNQLSSIPWKINTAILDIVIKIFQKGGSVELNVPQSVSALSAPPAVSKTATAEEKRKAAIAMARYRQKKYDVFSLWCDTLYKLSIANHFRNKIFWLPHNLDFRGRVYPVPPHLNHLSSDLGRSLLLFAKGKRLGPNGLDWLKLHVINLTNFKKGTSVKERLKFANENIDNILDSANQPLTGNMWWAKSEEPWQTLAGCMEIANALKAPNVEEYVGTFPIHQDGSCNGLQHYAALGRDQIGAESVNLYPFDKPRDVYNAVASIVENRRKNDANNEHKLAQVLEGFVKRKVIKQTVMTTVYGVTKYGAKHQIARQLKDTADFPEEYIWPASLYLTENTFHSLRTMFKSAREIQDWFTECARIISSICHENVEWITPLGLPIVQPYMKQQKSQFKDHAKNNEKPDGMKQRNAFAPNFIHSLDSTHMMLTSLHCNQENVTFVSVHDCFWTHPCTADTMNKICREQFVNLHSESILEDLAQFFVNRYLPVYIKLENQKQDDIENVRKCLTNVPSKGTFDINNVLLSTYFFS